MAAEKTHWQLAGIMIPTYCAGRQTVGNYKFLKLTHVLVDSYHCALVSPQPGRPTSIPLPDPTTNWQLIPRGRAMIVVPGGKTTYLDEEPELEII